MQLSNDQFKRIITQLRGTGGDNNNKRRTPRVGLRGQVTLHPLTGHNHERGPVTTVMVRDLGRNGIGLLDHRKLVANSLFEIRLPAIDEGGIVAVYRVKHCVLLEGGLYRIGGALQSVREGGQNMVATALGTEFEAATTASADGRMASAKRRQPPVSKDAA